MKVFIENSIETSKVKIFALEESAHKSIFFHYDGKNVIGQVVSDDAIESKIKPLLEVDRRMFEHLMVALVNQANEMNIRTENENHLKGKLEATELHLSDMREFAKQLIGNGLKQHNHES